MRGAFTGADSNKKGLIEVAEKGTIFLDEIGEMSPMVQVKLLRVLQERKFRRLGGTEEIDADIRIMAATNRDLSKMVAEGRFREDLFYRINVIPLRLPPLRERLDDIPQLAEHFVGEVRGADEEADHRDLAAPRWRACREYAWPGNIRELENAMERAVALEQTPTILPDSLPEQLQVGAPRAEPPAVARRARRIPRGRLRPRAARRRTSSASTSPRRCGGRRRQGQGRRAARHELPVVPVLHEEVQPEVGRCALASLAAVRAARSLRSAR